MNHFKTFMLMLVLTGIFILVGTVIGGRSGAIYAFIFAGLMNFVMYWFSDKIVLRMYRAKEVSQGEAPELYQIVGELVNKASLPMPKVCWFFSIPHPWTKMFRWRYFHRT